jgi:hypothetical protein
MEAITERLSSPSLSRIPEGQPLTYSVNFSARAISIGDMVIDESSLLSRLFSIESREHAATSGSVSTSGYDQATRIFIAFTDLEKLPH